MTRFQALFIKYLRVRYDGSWRWVAAKYNNRYTENKPFNYNSTFGGNQIDGIQLCEDARILLSEEVTKDGWN